MSITTVTSPILSPSQDEPPFGASFTDQNSNVFPLVAALQPDSSGHLSLGSAVLSKVAVSQVTDKPQAPQVVCPGGFKVPAIALVSLDSAGNPIPFQAALAASAAAVSGKFQSTERTATGSSESIAHGLGVVPSLVLVAVQDTNGVALPHTIVEGTHTSTNIVVTVTASLKYKVIAFA